MNDKDDYVRVVVPRQSIPEGARLIEAYESEREIVVCGDPPPFDESKPEDGQHNCDAMGCGTLSHVIYRFRKGEVEKTFELLERAMSIMENEAPDKTWFQEYFALTGEHMILTEDGWVPGGDRDVYEAEEILEEVNAPARRETVNARNQLP